MTVRRHSHHLQGSPVNRQLMRLQFLRFLFVGSVNTSLSYGLYALFLWLGLNYVLANGLAFVMSLLLSFATQGTFVFRSTDPRRLPRFVLAWVCIYGFNIALIGLLMHLGLSAYAAGAAALVPVTLLSYVAQKRVVFRALTPVPRAPAAPL